ncbi:MAG: DUF2029 domain-containing protein, partial [Planctomycetaceae bacterium]|nr:DUF2029 domain-containing protein [Planctomycetaceae bacterium]
MNTDESDSAVHDSNEPQRWGPFAPWPRARPWIWVALACLVAFFQLGLFLSEFRVEEGRGNDFFQDWASARNVMEGVPVYRSHKLAIVEYLNLDDTVEIQIPYNAHPPASVIWMLPFGLFSYPTGTLIWNLLSLGSILIAVAILLKTLCRPIAAWSVFPILVLTLTSYPLRMQFYLGQWNGFLLLLLVLGWYADRSGKEASAGVFLGIATLLKLFPGFILLVMLVRRRWRGVIWGGGTIAI